MTINKAIEILNDIRTGNATYISPGSQLALKIAINALRGQLDHKLSRTQ